MSKKYWKALSGILLALGMVALVLLSTHAAGGDPEWSTDTFADFCQGTMDGVDVWSEPGTARLDHRWSLNAKVNDTSDRGKLSPALSFVLTNTVSGMKPVFLAVWADERNCDHYPDIYFARSTDGGQSWSSDTKIYDDCDPDDPPYPNCPSLHTPDIAVRAKDESFWVVWQQDEEDTALGPDEGNIYCATSYNRGNTWPTITGVYTGAGKQLLPHIAPHGQSGYLYTLWEDERADDGDIYVSCYNPDVDSEWGAPIKISDDTTVAEQREPELAVDAAGNVYAVWEDTREDDDGEIYFSRWISGTVWNASNWSANTRLSDPTVDWAGDPDIIAAPGNVLYAAWYDRVSTGSAIYDFQIVVARSDDGGDTWNTPVVVQRYYGASAVPAFYDGPTLGADASGRVYVAWHRTDHSSNEWVSDDILLSISPDGGLHWTTPRVLSWPAGTVDTGYDPIYPALVAVDGQVVVVWQDLRVASKASPDIYATGYPGDHYLTSGEYKRTFDAGGPAAWGSITWTATLTPDTSLALATRVLTTAGAGWTEWFTHTASGEALPHPSSHFIQYRAVFTSNGNDTPILDEVVISYEQYRIYLPVVLKGA